MQTLWKTLRRKMLSSSDLTEKQKLFLKKPITETSRLLMQPVLSSEKSRVLAAEAYRAGYQVVIIGDQNHPEVIGINGWCNQTALILDSKEKAEEVAEDHLFIVCQTTIKKEMMEEVTDVFKKEKKALCHEQHHL